MLSLILASSSPRRRELLTLSGWTFTLRAVDAREVPHPAETPEAFVQRLSAEKAHLAATHAEPGVFIIGADTVVALDGRIIGKPANAADAILTLKQLRNRAHEVFTGLTVLDTRTEQAYTSLARSQVPMQNYTDAEIETYVATGNPLDKAGSYAIQYEGFAPVAREAFGDCFANVMGLPLCHLLRQLRQLGLDAEKNVPLECQTFIPYQCPVFEKILAGEA